MHSISRRAFLKRAGFTAVGLSLADVLRLHPFTTPAHAAGLANFPDPATMDRVLTRALARGGDYADLFIERRMQTQIRVAGSAIDSFEHGILQGGGVRTLRGEQTGYAYAETLDPEELARVADAAAVIASGAGGSAAVPVRAIEFARHVSAREAIGDATMAQRIAILERVDRAARAVGPAIQQVVIDYADELQTFAIATSEGRLAHDELPVIYLRVTVNAQRDGRAAEGAYRGSLRAGMEFLGGDLPEQAGRFAAEQALRMLAAQPAPTGELPVVVAAGGGVMFHEAVGHGLEADGVLRDASVFTGKLGQRVGSELVTLYDDSTPPNERGSFNIDDEATSAQRT